MKYQQLTEGDRYMIIALKRQGLSVINIAKAIGKHRSTLYREFRRNTCWHQDGSYRPIKRSDGQKLDADVQGEISTLPRKITPL